MDLVSTIGESAALGASGVVMWGATQDYNNKVTTVLWSTLTGWTGLLPVNFHILMSVLNVAAGGCTVKDLVLSFLSLFLFSFSTAVDEQWHTFVSCWDDWCVSAAMMIYCINNTVHRPENRNQQMTSKPLICPRFLFKEELKAVTLQFFCYLYWQTWNSFDFSAFARYRCYSLTYHHPAEMLAYMVHQY